MEGGGLRPVGRASSPSGPPLTTTRCRRHDRAGCARVAKGILSRKTYKMRVKFLGREGARKVLLVYPTTLDEYRQALETLGRAACPGTGHGPARAAAHGPQHGGYVVTSEAQRHRWGLPDLTARADTVDEAQALEVLRDAAEWSASAVELPAEAAPSTRDRKIRW